MAKGCLLVAGRSGIFPLRQQAYGLLLATFADAALGTSKRSISEMRSNCQQNSAENQAGK